MPGDIPPFMQTKETRRLRRRCPLQQVFAADKQPVECRQNSINGDVGVIYEKRNRQNPPDECTTDWTYRKPRLFASYDLHRASGNAGQQGNAKGEDKYQRPLHRQTGEKKQTDKENKHQRRRQQRTTQIVKDLPVVNTVEPMALAF